MRLHESQYDGLEHIEVSVAGGYNAEDVVYHLVPSRPLPQFRGTASRGTAYIELLTYFISKLSVDAIKKRRFGPKVAAGHVKIFVNAVVVLWIEILGRGLVRRREKEKIRENGIIRWLFISGRVPMLYNRERALALVQCYHPFTQSGRQVPLMMSLLLTIGGALQQLLPEPNAGPWKELGNLAIILSSKGKRAMMEAL
jgi:hypothetical protein